MVRNNYFFIRKTLFLLILFNIFVFNTYSQDAAAPNNTTTVSSFESDTSYFNPSLSSSNTAGNNQDSGFKAPSTTGIILRVIFVLILIVAAIYFIMMFFKKKNTVVNDDDDFLRRVSSINLAPGKSVEVVTLVNKCYVLGVTDSNITLIDKIQGDDDSELPEGVSKLNDTELIEALNLNFDRKQNTKKPMNFTDVLQLFMPGGLRNASANNSFETKSETASRKNTNKKESAKKRFSNIYSEAENTLKNIDTSFEINNQNQTKNAPESGGNNHE
ncbi:MAG: flagellar biosynthetic protein FliO [Treponema sp.]|nr:flagellar biosynthetic protein FliO [Treponema sp.]